MFNWKEMLLTLLIFSPLLGILLVAFVPRDRAGFFKWTGVIVSLIPLALSLYLYTQFDYTNGKTQFVEQSTWVNFFPNQGEKEGIPLD